MESKVKYDFSKKFNLLSNEIEKLKIINGKYIIYGNGLIGEYIYSRLENNIVAVVDQKSELDIYNTSSSIYTPKILKNLEYDKVIISVFGREESISEYLIDELKVEKQKIHTIGIAREFHSNDYEIILTPSSYSPWNKDIDFLDIYETVKENTLVDIYRCYELWTMVEQSKKLEDGALIEIGVWRGGTGSIIANKAQKCSIKNRVYLCDTFKGVVKASENDTHYSGAEHADTSLDIVESLVSNFKLQNIEILKGIFPDDHANYLKDEKFRFCHIDVDVYQSAEDILNWIWDKMVSGGIVVYDDYGFDTCSGIVKHVEQQRYLSDRLVMHNLNGHAIIIKL